MLRRAAGRRGAAVMTRLSRALDWLILHSMAVIVVLAILADAWILRSR